MPAKKSLDKPSKSIESKSSLIDDDLNAFTGTNVLSSNEIPLSAQQEKAIKGKKLFFVL